MEEEEPAPVSTTMPPSLTAEARIAAREAGWAHAVSSGAERVKHDQEARAGCQEDVDLRAHRVIVARATTMIARERHRYCLHRLLAVLAHRSRDDHDDHAASHRVRGRLRSIARRAPRLRVASSHAA